MLLRTSFKSSIYLNYQILVSFNQKAFSLLNILPSSHRYFFYGKNLAGSQFKSVTKFLKSINHKLPSVSATLKPFPCPYCSKGFNSKHPLKVHVNAVHLGLKLYSCPWCRASFNQPANLCRHRKTCGVKQGIHRF